MFGEEEENDSYRAATEGPGLADDNRTATGQVKSYRKTPYSSRYVSKASSLNEGELPGAPTVHYSDLISAPVDEHRLLLHELFTRLVTDPQMGLTVAQARANLELYGPNEIVSEVRVPEWIRFCKSLFGPAMYILWAGVILCFADYSVEAGKQESPPFDSALLGTALLVVILVTSLLSFAQESRRVGATLEFEKACPLTARVIREGEEREVPAEEIVMGDVLLVRAGERIAADCRILEANNGFMVDNSALTGESEPQERDIHCTHDDQLLTKNMGFFATYAVQGDCRAVVTRTGVNTVVGRMTELTENTRTDRGALITREVSKLIHIVTGGALTLAFVFFVIAFILGYFWLDAVLFLMGVIVAIVPEGLLAVVTIALSLSAKRLYSRNTAVKNLEALETLGATSIILCDKTGTLTANRAAVAHMWFDNTIGEVDTAAPEGSAPAVSFDVQSNTWKNLARAAVLCSRAQFAADSDEVDVSPRNKKEVIGAPIEAALLRSVESIEGRSQDFRSLHPKVAEIPFSPIIKFQLSLHETPDVNTRGHLACMMGDPEAILNRSASALVDGQERPLDDDYMTAFRYACSELGGLGERLVALADRRLEPEKFPPGFQFDPNHINFPLSGFRLLGIVSLMDPPRASVPDAVAKCQAAGIKVIMITGDHPATAKAIAKSVCILSLDEDPQPRSALAPGTGQQHQSCLVTGEEALDMTQDELDSVLMHHQEVVLAGFSADQKLAVVESCQRLGAVVAVTGDGVNDAAALRRADVGVAMGSGAEIAKDAADVVLLDDNLASVVTAVEEGRIMFDNLRKILAYTLASSASELAPFVLFLIAQVPLPIGALTVLCLDLGTDLLPAVSLAYEEEETEHEAMKRGPRHPLSEGLLDEKLALVSAGQMGLIQAAAGIFTYFVIMAENGFWPSKLLGLRVLWDSRAINDLRDSYDQEWTYEDRKRLEFSCHAGFFFALVTVRWACLLSARTKKLSIFQKGMRNHMLNFALIFETLLALILIYLPGLNWGLQMDFLYPVMWFPPIPFIFLAFAYDEIRKGIIRKHPGGWMEKETCY